MMIMMSQGAVTNNILNNITTIFIFHKPKMFILWHCYFNNTVTKLMVCVISWPEKG